jgi:hypothetical protein
MAHQETWQQRTDIRVKTGKHHDFFCTSLRGFPAARRVVAFVQSTQYRCNPQLAAAGDSANSPAAHVPAVQQIA